MSQPTLSECPLWRQVAAFCGKRLPNARATLFLGILFATTGLMLEPAKAVSPARQILGQLHGVSIYQADPQALAAAVAAAVAANPGSAAAILSEALCVGRPDTLMLAGRLTGATIAGLGPEPPKSTVTLCVRMAVELRPKAVLLVVTECVAAAPKNLAPTIVRAAVGALKKPSKELTEQIVKAALRAKHQTMLAQTDGKAVVDGKDGKDGKAIVSGSSLPPAEFAMVPPDGFDDGDPDFAALLRDAAAGGVEDGGRNGGTGGTGGTGGNGDPVERHFDANGPGAIPPRPPSEGQSGQGGGNLSGSNNVVSPTSPSR